MADAVNVSDLDHLWDPKATPLFTVKPPEWVATYLPRYCQSVSDRADSDCRGLALTVRELQREGFWQRIFPDWETCCQALFKRPAAWVEQVVEGVRVLHAQGHNGPISRAQAVAAQEHAQQMLSLESPRFAGEGNPHGNRDNITVRSHGEGGTSAGYLAARLKKAGRDDLLDQIGPGKPHRSVRSAAIAAGIVKPVPTIRLVEDLAKVAAGIRKHLTAEQVQQLVVELTGGQP
jgi:stage V sporulation protein SpoVS